MIIIGDGGGDHVIVGVIVGGGCDGVVGVVVGSGVVGGVGSDVVVSTVVWCCLCSCCWHCWWW